MLKLRQHYADLSGVSLVRRFAEVPVQGVEERLLMLFNGVAQVPQLRAAKRQRAGRAGAKERALTFDAGVEIHNQVAEHAFRP